jgi:hypothetical protein
MSNATAAPVGRTSEGEDLVNTLTTVLEVVKIRFQIAPGTGANLGIADAEYKLLSGSTEIASGTTTADGEIEVPLQPLLTGAVTVRIFESDFNLTLHGGLEAVTTLKGQQKRYDILGYHTGYLRDVVGNGLPDDGRDGPKTQQCIMNVQTDGSLAIDGTVGNQTRTELTSKAGE